MEGKKDSIVRLDEAKSETEIEKEKVEIFGIPFAFPDIVREEYTKGKDGEKNKERLAVYEKEINKLISEAEQKGEGADVEKTVKAFLKSRKAKEISRYLNKAVKESENEEDVETGQKEQEAVITEKGAEQKEVEVAETKEDDITNEVNDLIENIKIKLGAAQVSGIISEKKLEKFEEIFNGKIVELNEILKGEGSTDNSEAKLNEFYEDLLRLKDTFFRPAKDIEAEQIKKVKERYKKKKKPSTKSKKDKFYQRKENPADESLSLEKDPGNPGQHFDFIDEEKETEYKNEIKEINNFENLFKVIEKIGRMKNNSDNIILAELVIKKIEKTRGYLKRKSENFDPEDKELARLWKEHLNLIPKICGIRNKAGELIRKEIYGKKEASGKQEEANQEEKKEFTERELKTIEIYEQSARETLRFIAEINYVGDYDYDEKDVPALIEMNKKRFWKKYAEETEEEIENEKRFPKEKIEMVIEFLKNKV